MHKQFHIKTYGCQMNVYDSDRISDLLIPMGYTKTDKPEESDLVIINTCHIREKASEKLYSDLGRLSKFKINRNKLGSDLKIVVTGCVAQAEGEEIIRRNKDVDLVLGPQNYHKITSFLKKTPTHKLHNHFPNESKFDHFPKTKTNEVSAFVTIQEGCDKFCSFCVVPYTRGPEFSRTVNEIVFDIKHLSNQGVREITLLGQNVSDYSGTYNDGISKKRLKLADLIKRISDIKNIERIRYITSHPSDISSELINEHKTNFKLMPYLHLPIQSGSNKILKKMNRGYTQEHYISIVKEIKKVRKDFAVTSDFIVGFPGETDEDFNETLKITEEIDFAASYSFKYSPRPGTPSSLLDEHVPENVSDERLKILQKKLDHSQKVFNNSFIGKKVSVLFEKEGKKINQYVGRSEYLQPVHVISDDPLIGKILDVKINKVEAYSLHGQINQ